MQRSEDEHRRLVQRLKRVEGQVAAIRRMVEEAQDCPKVLVQISAARGALGKVGEVMLRDHVEHCVADAVNHGTDTERRARVEELVDLMGRFSGLGAGT